MPVYNEEPERVIRHLAETVASFQATVGTGSFAVFLLSDTQDPGPRLGRDQPPSPPGVDGRGAAFAPSTAAARTITGTRPATFGTSLSGMGATSISC